MAAIEPQQVPDAAQLAITDEKEAPKPINTTTNTNTDAAATATPSKPIHALVVDTGPLIKNDPPVSTLLAQAHELYTLPSVITEIRDAATRSRVETTLLPFLKLRSPRPESVKFVTDFARRTGDLEVLSRPDLHLIALTYELECERNGGDWRLRKTPGQKGLNGKAPSKENVPKEVPETETETVQGEATTEVRESDAAQTIEPSNSDAVPEEPTEEKPEDGKGEPTTTTQETITQALESLSLEPSEKPTVESSSQNTTAAADPQAPEEDDDDDEDGWITPSNLKKHQAKDQLSAPEQPIQRILQAALLTSDYAMQNVLLRMNLNLVSPSLARITRVKTWVLRCHGCFQVTRDTSKQFCPRCGQPTLTRVSCSTDSSGNFTLHLKRNFQWNNRGNVYSVPKPVHGSASGKARTGGGGKNGWGRDLILAEDQKEYVKKAHEEKRARTRDLMDEDYLPGILTGERRTTPGRIRVGAGKNVNSRKR
ncbi:Nin one binding Zn-ribbon like-domain-containing protein [Biscogniauxia mediterranea]|nr:Nin one binding Zn-ribbon like-domain-containing protein [Biscogniauxia mediterranea]